MLTEPAPAQDHRQAALRPQRHALHRPHLVARLEVKPEMPGDRGKHDDRLLQREAGADADARARAEGQIGKAVDPRTHVREEARRIEAVGLVP
jgi:hypothetical protein